MAEGSQGIAYAEQQLGVHSVYSDARLARANLQAAIDEIYKARFKKREAEVQLTDREMEVAAEAWAAHPDFSAAKMDQHLKVAKHNDPKCRELREVIFDATSRIEAQDTSRVMYENDLKIAVSRLQELGGYLHYLAAIKQAHTASKA